MSLVRRGCGLPEVLADIPLPRVPSFHGGLVQVQHDEGAVMRSGERLSEESECVRVLCACL